MTTPKLGSQDEETLHHCWRTGYFDPEFPEFRVESKTEEFT